MGIPSYYRTLIMKMPHAIKRNAPHGVQTLVVDMNCMIYHVLREPTMLAQKYSVDSSATWERKLQAEVCSYLEHIWKSAGTPAKVYVALDGVVPYAKIKQQRYRRFKSASLRSGGSDDTCWDTNAITPGTEFMRAMGSALKMTGLKHGWKISDTDEPGEGEHKVLQWLRSATLSPGPIVVYGLDADLILLSLLAGDTLGPTYSVYLLREAMAFGKLVRLQGSEEADLCFFEVDTLRTSLERGTPWTRQQLYDYIFGMSFCGNDFLPTGLSLRIRDEGHSILLSGLHALWSSKKHLVTFSEDGSIAKPSQEGLLYFSTWIMAQEERLIVTTIKRKMTARFGENDDDNLPLKEQAEQPLVEPSSAEVKTPPTGVSGLPSCTLTVLPRAPNLRPEGSSIWHPAEGTSERLRLRKDCWESQYAKLALGSDDIMHRKARVAEFWKGWCWILDYYQGLPVDLEWVYSAGYPPTWKDLCAFFTLPTSVAPSDNFVALQPKEQLALVLPLSSWNLLLRTEFRDLPAVAPQYWPNKFRYETFGKRFGWECEPMIPMLTPACMRYYAARIKKGSK